MAEQEVSVTRASDGAPASQAEKTATASRKLLEAAKLIETALVLLDTHSEACGGCGSQHYRNFAHAIAYRKLTDTPHRLRIEAAEIVGEKSTSNRRRHSRGHK